MARLKKEAENMKSDSDKDELGKQPKWRQVDHFVANTQRRIKKRRRRINYALFESDSQKRERERELWQQRSNEKGKKKEKNKRKKRGAGSELRE